MKCKLTQVIPAAALVCLLLASCKKNDSVNSPDSQLPTELRNTANLVDLSMDEVTAEEFDEDAVDASESSDVVKAGDKSNGQTAGAEGCPVITYAPSKNEFPHTRTIDYGSGCSIRGKTFSGKRIIKVFANKKTAPAGTRISVTSYDNYYVNGLSVSGNNVIYIQKTAAPGPLKLRTVTNITYSDNSGNLKTFIGNFQREMISESIIKVTGTSYGVEANGRKTISTFTAAIDDNNPILKDRNCDYRSQGALKIGIRTLFPQQANDTEYLDYGNGTCDNSATLSINGGAPATVTLPIVFYAARL